MSHLGVNYFRDTTRRIILEQSYIGPIQNRVYLHVIDDKDQINQCEGLLSSKLCEAGKYKGYCRWGHQGNSHKAKTYWFPDEVFSWGYDLINNDKPRHWNAFSLEEPSNNPMTITCEINSYESNGDWHVTGAFVRDDDNNVYIVHTGGIRGKDVTMKRFKECLARHYQWIKVERNGKLKEVVVVSSLDDDDLIHNLAYFVKEVGRIKRSARGDYS